MEAHFFLWKKSIAPCLGHKEENNINFIFGQLKYPASRVRKCPE
jgi:hypothetical protein